MHMESFIDILKFFIGATYRMIWRLISLFVPVKKNRVMFESFHGRQFSCNPKAIYEYLKQTQSDLEFVWVFVNPEKFRFLENSNTKVCKYRSLKHAYYSITSHVLVFNTKRSSDLVDRSGQMRLETWHGGGCYKKIGSKIEGVSKFYIWKVRQISKRITHFIASSKYFAEEVVKKQYLYDGEILSFGMPRNDRMIRYTEPQIQEIALKIRKKLGIDKNAFVVLYAPTFRDSSFSEECEQLDLENLRNAVEQRFCKRPLILFRGHHETNGKGGNEDSNVSDYPDMQDILLISDVLLTDYSSSIWDFSFTNKPVFLYTPDLKEYQKKRGFCEDIYTWGFPVSETNKELVDQIVSFDEEQFHRNMNLHHAHLGSYESGNATRMACDLIMRTINEE